MFLSQGMPHLSTSHFSGHVPQHAVNMNKGAIRAVTKSTRNACFMKVSLIKLQSCLFTHDSRFFVGFIGFKNISTMPLIY